MVTKTEKEREEKAKEALENIKPKNYFEELSRVDCSGKIEKKNGLSYLSWAFAWGEIKKRYPLSFYTIYENEQGYNYFTDGRTCWVKTGVTVVFNSGVAMADSSITVEPTKSVVFNSGVAMADRSITVEPTKSLEHIEYLPVMDFRNNSIPLEKITSFDVNKTIQRSLTKAVARHGLGLYIYAGEDLPETDNKEPAPAKATTEAKQTATAAPKKPNKVREQFVNFCNENDVKGEEFNAICEMYKLNNAAPDENFKNALEYAKTQVKKRIYAEAKANSESNYAETLVNEALGDYPEEV